MARKSKTIFTIGFLAGVGIGALLSSEAPGVNAILTAPLRWITEGLHPFPSQSPANLIVALPLWFIYWGCLGGLIGLLLQAAVRVFSKRKGIEDKE